MSKAIPSLLAISLLLGCSNSAPTSDRNQAARTTAANEKRILPTKVSLSNVDVFEKQMRSDLPPGTAKDEVESYLTRWKIPHSFANSRYPVGGNTFQGEIEHIGERMIIFDTSLAIRIHLDGDEKVDEIKFRLDYK
jgi:hypothetical protein